MSKARGPYRVDPLGYKKKAPALLNGLTEDETNATASVVGLVGKPAQQEPVAWIDEYGNAFPLAAKQYSVVGKHWKPLYTSPSANANAGKPWVGLTDEEIQKEFHPLHATGLQFARSIEAKLKEKNA